MAILPADASQGRAQSRLDVGVISAGRVGTALAAALQRAGHHIVAATAISDESKSRADRVLPGTPIRPINHVAEAASLLLLAVPDDALGDIVKGLASSGHLQPGQLIFHTSGAHGLDVLQPAASAGALPMAIHPAMTFTGRAEDLDRMDGISYAVTADEALQPIAGALVVEMGGEPHVIAESNRTTYHAALTHGANHLNTLISDALDMLRVAGVNEPARLIAPVLSASLDNTLRLGDKSLTGPVRRGDAGTVARHLAALSNNLPDAVDAYRTMARRTADRALDNGTLKTDEAERLLDVLANRPRGEEQ